MKNKKITVFLVIFLTTLFISIPLFKFNEQYDDGIQHVVRLIETLRSFKNGSIFTVIMQKLCNGFGYSWNLFYSPLTAYLPLVFRIFGFSFSNCLKIFMFFISIASGYSMYFFMKKILKSRDINENAKNNIAILASAFYILAPYRLTDMYLRVAIAELASFVFIPIIFNGLYTIINQKQKSLILCFGVIGLVLSHTLIAFYTAIFCLIYILVNIKEIKGKEFLELLKNIILALLVTSFYWVPLLESKFSANYEVFNPSHMIRENVLIDAKVNPLELLFIKNGRMAYFLGIPVIIGLLLSFSTNKKIQDKKNYYLFLILGLISVFLTLDFIPFEKFPYMFKMMQFSFRLLEFSTFFLTVIASINIGLYFKKFSILPTILIICFMADLLIPIYTHIDFSPKSYSEESLIDGIRVTQNTGRVHAGCASFEYLPNKAFDNRKYIEEREDTALALDENVEIKDFSKDKTNCSFKVQGKGKVELPYIYYIGYSAKINNKNLKITESENGFCQIEINSEDFEEVNVSYTGTTLMQVSLVISIISTIGIITYLILNLCKKRDKMVYYKN